MLIPIEITDKAREEIQNIMATKNIPSEYMLRVGVKGGGCGGMAYNLGFDIPKENDQQFEIDGIPVLMEKRHVMFLMGMRWIFMKEPSEGFYFCQPKGQGVVGY